MGEGLAMRIISIVLFLLSLFMLLFYPSPFAFSMFVLFAGLSAAHWRILDSKTFYWIAALSLGVGVFTAPTLLIGVILILPLGVYLWAVWD